MRKKTNRKRGFEVISVERKWYRVIDDSGEDYLYSPDYFEILEEGLKGKSKKLSDFVARCTEC